MINKGSASASEIVSGVIQDYDRGVLMGQRSYGKGLVQNTRDIGYNSKVKLTTAKYYIPSQRCIQSVEYKDGEPVDIADNKRAKFKTRNGRTVLDGGGVSPDVDLKHPTDAPVIKSLLRQNMIFDFVTQFAIKNDSISAVKDFSFTDFDSFLQFLDDRNFHYDTESEEMLSKIQKKSEEEGLDITPDIDALKFKIKSSQQGQVEKHKEVILDLIETEIASRYYYQNGKIQMNLKNDMEIDEAVELIRDPERYKSLLQG